jgi:hypothetical protein
VRGLPPPPANVAHIEFDCATNDARWSIGFWVELAPDPPYYLPDLQQVFAQVVIAGTQLVNKLTSNATSIRTSRLSLEGMQAVSFLETVAFNSGALGGAQANSVATPLHWVTERAGKSGQAMTYMGGFADDFTDDHLTLNDVGMNQVRNEGVTFINAVDAAHYGAILQATLGTLSRSVAAHPRLSSVFLPFVGIVPARKLGTIRRRMYASR